MCASRGKRRRAAANRLATTDETPHFEEALDALRTENVLGIVTRSEKGCVVVEGDGAAVYHASSNVAWQMFPAHGSYFDPRVTGLITAALAVGIVMSTASGGAHKCTRRCLGPP